MGFLAIKAVFDEAESHQRVQNHITGGNTLCKTAKIPFSLGLPIGNAARKYVENGIAGNSSTFFDFILQRLLGLSEPKPIQSCYV